MDNKRFRKRITRFGVGTTFLFVLLILHLFRIQVIKHEYFKEKSNKQIRNFYKETGKRGRIIAATGEDLAYDTYESDLIIDPKRFVDLENGLELLEYLKKFDDIDIDYELNKLYTLREKRYYKLITNLTSSERDEIEGKLKELKVRRNEVFFEKRNKRVYNNEDMFRHIVGFMGYSPQEKNKIVGRFGIEKYFEDYLNPGVINVERYLSGNKKREIPTVQKKSDKKIDKNGDSVVLTIDYVMQYIVQNEFGKFWDEYKPNWMAGIMVNPQTGEILAMNSLPVKEVALSRNNAIQNRYEPGSVFKPLIVAGALEEGFIDTDTIIENPNGRIKKYDATIKDASRSARGNLTPEDILIKSSNVGMVKIAEKIPSDIYEYYLKQYGLYSKTDVEFMDEPFIKQTEYKNWDGLKKYTMSFGQGIAVTPLQMVMSFASVINGGILYKPTIVKEIVDESGEVLMKTEPVVKNRVISKEISAKLRKMLYSVVEVGTGKNARIPGYAIGGKTGTSQKSVDGKYAKDKFIISFAGFYPVDKPRYLLLVVADEPKIDRGAYGGALMAPLYKRIMEKVFKYKKILPKNIDIMELDEDLADYNREVNFVMEEMPELTNLSMRDIIKIFDGTGIEVEFVGDGMVYKQEPKIGTPMKQVKKVKLYLKE